MNATPCNDHNWMKIVTFTRELKIEDLHLHQETSDYHRKEKHLTFKADVIGTNSPLKGLSMESTSIKESKKTEILKLDAGKITGNRLNINVMYCSKCCQQLPAQEVLDRWMNTPDRAVLSEIKTLYKLE